MMQIGSIPVTNSMTRPVFRSDDSRQYVLNDNSAPVYGIWLHSDEYQEPIVRLAPGT